MTCAKTFDLQNMLAAFCGIGILLAAVAWGCEHYWLTQANRRLHVEIRVGEQTIQSYRSIEALKLGSEFLPRRQP